MTKLIPVKRVDRNGVLTTKHVRADSGKTTPATPVPAPTLTSQMTAAKNAASSEQKRWRVNINKWGDCDEDLKFICAEYHPAVQTYECSDAEAYDVTTVINPGNALPLLSIGIRSAEDALKFLDETGTGDLKSENNFADQAIDRGIPARAFIDFAAKYYNRTNDETFMDAAECWANPALHQADDRRSSNRLYFLKPITEMILDGDITWSDIKEIGIKTVAERAAGTNFFMDHMVRMTNGTSGLRSAAEIVDVMSDFTSNKNLDLADVYGLDGYRRLPAANSWTATHLMPALRERDHSMEERFAIFEYAMRVGLNPDPKDTIALYEAGISSEEARLGIVSKLTAHQIVGLHSGEVASSVSSGYL